MSWYCCRIWRGKGPGEFAGIILSFGLLRGIILPEHLYYWDWCLNTPMYKPEQAADCKMREDGRTDEFCVILASASPRRRELLALLEVPFIILPTEAEEETHTIPPEINALLPPCPLTPDDHPTVRAWRKANDAWKRAQADVVLGADTVVVLDGKVLNKPRNPDDAHAMLAQLAGRSHTVYTGLCVYARQSQSPLLDLVASDVTIAPLNADEIAAYVATGEPMDKAGGYGIQGLGGRLVQQVVGSYTAVVGLPLPSTWQLLTQAGIAPMKDPTDAYYTWLRNQRKEPLPCPPTLP